jgi:hypothetical protein
MDARARSPSQLTSGAIASEQCPALGAGRELPEALQAIRDEHTEFRSCDAGADAGRETFRINVPSRAMTRSFSWPAKARCSPCAASWSSAATDTPESTSIACARAAASSRQRTTARQLADPCPAGADRAAFRPPS